MTLDLIKMGDHAKWLKTKVPRVGLEPTRAYGPQDFKVNGCPVVNLWRLLGFGWYPLCPVSLAV